jgi:predicted transcriptional regulator
MALKLLIYRTGRALSVSGFVASIRGGTMRGRKSTSRLLIVGLAFILLAPLAISSASADSTDIELVISIDETTTGAAWYDEGESLSISISVKNSGATTQSIEYNPSCPVEVEILNNDDELFTSLRDHRVCLQQRRAIDIPAGQTRNLDTFDWDWQNSTGAIINSGDVTLDFNFESGMATYTESIQFQRSPVLIENLELQVNTAPPINGGLDYLSGESVYSHISLTNSGSNSITIDTDEGCMVTIQVNTFESSNPPSMTDLGCGSGSTLGVGESLPLGWLVWDFTSEGEQLLSGQWSIEVATTGLSGLASTFDATLSISEARPEAPAELAVSLLGDGGADGIITDADNIQVKTELINPAGTPAELQFNNSCLVSIQLISEEGMITKDSRLNDICDTEFSELKIDPASQYTLDQRMWTMNAENSCELNDGSYLMVVTVPEYGITTEHLINYDGGDSGPACLASMQDTSLAEFRVIELLTNNPGTNQESITFQIRLENQIDLDIHWPQECRLTFTLQRIGESQPHQIWNEQCGESGGMMETIAAGNGIPFDPFTIEFGQLNQGTWSLFIETTGTPRFTTQLAHTWNPPTQLEDEQNSEEESENEDTGDTLVQEDATLLSWMAEGSWQYVTTDVGGCWILIDADGFEHAYSSTIVENWKPLPNHRGAYWVEESTGTSTACASWVSHIVVAEVLGETQVASTDSSIDTEVTSETPVISIPAAAPTIVAVIASAGLLALIAGAVTQVEWIRLPATKYGLVLLGMVRKKKESGGEYQRGRIVAYIELHRGIHFRALLGALQMSNGQLTHHLSVLESDERVWRRKDGRKVRYYPASIDSRTADDDLPVPVLTPDPNSLQGKILQILDIHENEILNLSQKELSVKLETSQQLVSYHLKSLEDWGLVEKERVAMRYRYRLTDRALILLNSGNFPSLLDEV